MAKVERKLESAVQAKIIKRFKMDGWMVIKLIQTTVNGIPDLLCIRDGRVVFIEVKRPGEKPDPLQLLRRTQLLKQGVEVYYTDDENFTLP